MKYRAVNYSMGREMSVVEVEADNDADAMKLAEKKLPGKHAAAPNGTKVAVIGLTKEPYKA